MTAEQFDSLNEKIIQCSKCRRLCEWREQVAREKRKSYAHEDYWGRPVPNFGDAQGRRLIVGLAPAAHGANRTGRMFTGDRSGDWLYRALFRAGAANQELSAHRADGLALRDVLITAVAHCAPPDNKPSKEEIANCSEFLSELLVQDWKAILCLGEIAWVEVARHFRIKPVQKFKHGAEQRIGDVLVIASYHPSQQNTFTRRLTESMLDDVVSRFTSWRG